MYRLKALSPEAVHAALEKAHLYRMLNEPREAESICLDVLNLDSENQVALVRLVLALTDQFREGGATVSQVERLLPRLRDEYERWYYTGLTYERWGKSQHGPGRPTAVTADWYHEALKAFEQAEKLRPAGNDDVLLRWNSVVRSLRSEEHVKRKFRHFAVGGDEL